MYGLLMCNGFCFQGSFYPLYPPSEEMSVDYEQLESKATMHRSFLFRTRVFFYQRSFQGATFAASPLRPEPLREGG